MRVLRACVLVRTCVPREVLSDAVWEGVGQEPRELSSASPQQGRAKNQIFVSHFFYLNLSKPLVAGVHSVYYVVMSTIYSYDDFRSFVGQEYSTLKLEDPTIRFGQVYFNCLWEFRPSIANAIRATEFDPFHKDEVHPSVHVHIEELWNEMNERVLMGDEPLSPVEEAHEVTTESIEEEVPVEGDIVQD